MFETNVSLNNLSYRNGTFPFNIAKNFRPKKRRKKEKEKKLKNKEKVENLSNSSKGRDPRKSHYNTSILWYPKQCYFAVYIVIADCIWLCA